MINKNEILTHVQLSHRKSAKRKQRNKKENKHKTKTKMTDVSFNNAIIKLKANGLNITKERHWQSGLKNMNQLHAAYKKSHFK